MKQIDKFDSQCNVSKKRKKRNIRQHGKIKEDKTTSRIFAGSFLLAIKIEFATQTHLKNTYFGNWATRKQSPHKKRERTVELKFNLRDDTSEGGYKRGRISLGAWLID